MRCIVECTPINILQLFCWPMTSFHHLPYDYLHPFRSWQYAYKNFDCYATANKGLYKPDELHSSVVKGHTLSSYVIDAKANQGVYCITAWCMSLNHTTT